MSREEGVSESQSGNAAATDAMPERDDFVFSRDEPILLTGAAGFIGSRVVEGLLERGFRNLICFARPTGRLSRLEDIQRKYKDAQIRIQKGNLLSRADCDLACKDVGLIIHLAASTGEKSFPDAFMNSVVTTRNLLEAGMNAGRLRRFVLVSSFSVYTNCNKPNVGLLDESCPLEERGDQRGEAYCFAKVKQEQLVAEYGQKFHVPYVVVRPGNVYGPGKKEILGRVGINTFGFFMHIGGSNRLPLTYVDNCAEAIVLAALVRGVEGETFNVVDDDLPSSRQFLRGYKKNVRRFPSVYIPHLGSYGLCYLWEKYSDWSQGQLPRVFNRKRWHAYWKSTRYTNAKLKSRLGWRPRVSTEEGLKRYFESCAQDAKRA